MAQYIWSGAGKSFKFHLVKLKKIARPKKLGGWGIINIRCFGWALLLKLLWWGIFGEGIWGKIFHYKYLKNKDFICWMRQGSIGNKKGSKIWCSFNKIKELFLQNIHWQFGTGHRIIMGKDRILGTST